MKHIKDFAVKATDKFRELSNRFIDYMLLKMELPVVKPQEFYNFEARDSKTGELLCKFDLLRDDDGDLYVSYK